MRRTMSAVLIAFACGCGGATSATETTSAARVVDTTPHDPCDGADLSLGEAAEHCRVAGDASAPPASDVIEVAIATRTLRSGADGVVDVALRNLSDAPVVLDFPGTLNFDASLMQGERRVDERWEISGIAGGSVQCRPGADCRTVRVRLAPGGRLVASLPMSGRVSVLRDGPRAGTIERSDGGPIPPGVYEVQVVLPWMDEVAGSTTGARRARVVRGAIDVTR
ncbi:hypothetical protein [Sandaracinus amylolyticus]|uniref:hypothetical protein n=1 Tax=Sandaracinus amylolyticus TaxID=927083 RepID=UPI001F21E863|nr:hypothetical protein [Sandaracinus amylolyticus]UJR83602.1 Hypothetical protein I5071_56700 [Sandaracinus amylolyticus]